MHDRQMERATTVADPAPMVSEPLLVAVPAVVSPPRRDEANPTFRLGYRPFLDGFRGVAVLLVIIHHARLVSPLGVDLFFVLSGFLITALLIQEWDRDNSIAFGRFYIRRALRLVPALLPVLAFVCLDALLFRGRESAAATGKAALVTICYLSNWAEAFQWLPLGVLFHTWSLSVEEQFYLCWPVTVFLLLKSRLRPWFIVSLLGIGAVVILVHRTILGLAGAPQIRLYVALDTRGDALLLGCILGFLVARGMIPRSRVFRLCSRVLAVLAVVCLICLLLKNHQTDQGLNVLATLAPLSAAAILLALFVSPSRMALWVLEMPLLIWIGRISYGLYLWNFPVCYILYKASWSWTFMVSVQVAATFLIATCSFYLWERPFLRLKQQAEPG